MELVRERDRVPHELRVTRWYPVDTTITPHRVIERVDLELNK